jgi:hypothetical protein
MPRGRPKRGVHIVDLIGQRFNRLTVTGERLGDRDAERPIDRKPKWECLCDCGNVVYVLTTHLRKNEVKSCGCLLKDTTNERCARDWTGILVGRLMPIRPTSERKIKMIAWECRCACGKVYNVSSAILTAGLRDIEAGTYPPGGRPSCGCYRAEVQGRHARTHGLSGTQAYKTFLAQKRECAKKLRTPKWADLRAILDIYVNVPLGHVVDHIYPLQGKLVSGLHIASNLQYLTQRENNQKYNLFTPEFIVANP